jgi:hypothetical protein
VTTFQNANFEKKVTKIISHAGKTNSLAGTKTNASAE